MRLHRVAYSTTGGFVQYETPVDFLEKGERASKRTSLLACSHVFTTIHNVYTQRKTKKALKNVVKEYGPRGVDGRPLSSFLSPRLLRSARGKKLQSLPPPESLRHTRNKKYGFRTTYLILTRSTPVKHSHSLPFPFRVLILHKK